MTDTPIGTLTAEGGDAPVEQEPSAAASATETAAVAPAPAAAEAQPAEHADAAAPATPNDDAAEEGTPPEPEPEEESSSEEKVGGELPKKEGWFARKKREFLERQRAKQADFQKAEERKNAKEAVMKTDYLSPSFGASSIYGLFPYNR